MIPQWAVDPDALDLNKKEVWEQYFDKSRDYYRLREIKAAVDPDDLFQSRFTLRPATKVIRLSECLEDEK